MARTLNDMMEIDHVIRVYENGTINDDVGAIYAPDLHAGTDDNGQILPEHDKEMMTEATRQGWELLTGYTGQYCYHGPLMHDSEYVGGDLEKHIRATAGYWVVTVVYTYDGEHAGWVVAHRD